MKRPILFGISLFVYCLMMTLTMSVYAKSLRYYKRQVRHFYRLGKKFATQKDYSNAIDQYIKALSIVEMTTKKPKFAKHRKELLSSQATFNYIIGRTCHFAKNYLMAYNYYKKCLKIGAKPKVTAQAQKYLLIVMTKLVSSIQFASNPKNASITLAGENGFGHFGHTPTVFQIVPGTYKITIRHKNYYPLFSSIIIEPKTSQTKFFHLKPIPKPRRVVVIHRPKPKPKPKTIPIIKILRWGTAGLAAVSLISGLVLVGQAQGEFDKVNEMRGKLKYKDKIDEINQAVQKGNGLQMGGVSFIVVGVLSGATSALLFTWKSNKHSSPKTNK